MVIKMVLISNFELIFETAAPKTVFSKIGHRLHEAVTEKSFRYVEALQLVHSFNLLLPSDACLIKRLILLLNS